MRSSHGNQSSPLFISRQGKPLTRFGIYKIVKRHTSDLQIHLRDKSCRGISPHVIRHSTAVGFLEQGVEINVIRAWLGHVSLDTTNRYAEITLRTKQAAVAALLPPVDISEVHSAQTVNGIGKDDELDEMAQFAMNVMFPSERGPPATIGLFASTATKRSAAQNLDYVSGNIIEHHDPRRTAKPAKCLLVKLGPHPRTRTEDQQPNRLATPAQRQNKQPRAAIFATIRIAHHRPRAVVNLRLFTELGLDDRPRFRRYGAAQIAHESPHALVATREPVAVDQILPDSHRVSVALQLQRDQFTVRFAAARRSATPVLLGQCRVITSMAAFESTPSESVIGSMAAFEGLCRPQPPGRRRAIPAPRR